MFKFIECRRISADFPNYISGRLASERITAIDTHVASCSGCATLLHEDRVMHRLLSPMQESTATPDLTSRLASRISNLPTRQPLFMPVRTFALSGAAAAVLLIGMVWNSRTPQIKDVEASYVPVSSERHVVQLASDIRAVQLSDWEQPSTAYPHSGVEARSLFVSTSGSK
ncbi:MAG: hypothetical protein ABJA67_00500 [Chthonomonadales bacterium]